MRTSNGCVICKRRKKKCDERKPHCVACERNGWTCSYIPTNVVGRRQRGRPAATNAETLVEFGNIDNSVSYQTPSTSGDYSNGASGSSEQLTLSPSTISGQSRLRQLLELPGPRTLPNGLGPSPSGFLYDHYIHHTAPISCAAVSSHIPFVDGVMPLALSSDMVLNSMLAFSGFHFQHHYSSIYAVESSQHYSQALFSLRAALSGMDDHDRDNTAVKVFVSMLLLCGSELMKEDEHSQANALYHLKACRHLAHTALQSPFLLKDESMHVFASELYTYILATSTFSIPSESDVNLGQDLEWAFSNLVDQNHKMSGFMMGCATELFSLIFRATAASRAAVRSIDQSNTVPEELSQEIDSLSAQIQSWDDGSDNPMFTVHAGIYRLALLAMLVVEPRLANGETFATTLTSEPAKHRQIPPVDSLIDDALFLLACIDVSEGIAISLSWPLAVLGACAPYDYQREAIGKFLRDMHEARAFGNIRRLLNLLKLFWATDRSSCRHAPTELLSFMLQQGQPFLLA